MKYLFYIIVFFSFLFSCSSKNKERRIKVDDVVDYREVLFGVDDSLPLIEIYTRLPANQVCSRLEHLLQRDICGEGIDYNIKLKGEKLSKCFIQKHCKLLGCGIRKGSDVLINFRGQILYEREFIDINDLDSLIYQHLIFKSPDLKKEFITIDWLHLDNLRFVPADSLIKVFKGIKHGYLLTYDSLSRQYFNNRLDHLNLSELDSLNKILNYKVIVGDLTFPKSPPPPAPPPIPLDI